MSDNLNKKTLLLTMGLFIIVIVALFLMTILTGDEDMVTGAFVKILP